MPTITIQRGGGWTDRLRAYTVKIDGVECGSVHAKGIVTIDVSAGRHEVQLWVGPIYSSAMRVVEVGDEGRTLLCKPNAIPGLAILSLARPGHWISLEAA